MDLGVCSVSSSANKISFPVQRIPASGPLDWLQGENWEPSAFKGSAGLQEDGWRLFLGRSGFVTRGRRDDGRR